MHANASHVVAGDRLSGVRISVPNYENQKLKRSLSAVAGAVGTKVSFVKIDRKCFAIGIQCEAHHHFVQQAVA